MTSSVRPPSPRTQAPPDDGPATHVVDLTPAPPDPRPAEAGVLDWGGPVDGFGRTAVAAPTPSPRGHLDPSAPHPDDDRPPATFPQVGDEFLGFRLEGELGRGAFGRVYLARQGELAARPVALKVTTKASGEPQTLAQLQHTNIVPVYSVHRAGPLQAVCMPYFGSVTLDDVVGGLRGRDRVPGSGSHFVSTLNQRRASTTPGPGSGGTPSDSDVVPPAGVPRAVSTNEILARLSKFSYAEAVLWLGARLADGLAHAHDRGVVHRDLKPANVLLTDEGQPMLLDFNLADDANSAPGSTARVGGTLPYMSPEQLEVFRTRVGTVDARSDVYSLGLMLYELLGGRHPFPTPPGAVARILPQMVADRKAGPPPLRRLNRAVTPAVEAIVRRCLHPDPAGRYPSARALQEDLERQLAHRPLLHTREPSVRERVRKWARRNPRLTSSGRVFGLAAGLVVGLGCGLYSQREQLRRQEAIDGWSQFGKDKRRLEVSLAVGTPDARAAALTEAGRVMAAYGVPDDAGWADRPAVTRLPEADQKALRLEMGELLFFAARATDVEMKTVPPHGAARDRLARAVLLSERAVECFAPHDPGWAVLAQRDQLRAELAGVEWEGTGRTGRTPPPRNSPVAAYLLGADLAVRGEYEPALEELTYAVGRKPDHFPSRFVLGNCLAALGRDAEAEAAFEVCVALAPDDPRARNARGWVRLRLGKPAAALADFEEVLRLQPGADGYLNRAAARHAMGKFADEIGDLTSALRSGAAPARVYFPRALAYTAVGDRAAAARDLAAGFVAGDAVREVVTGRLWRGTGAK